MKPLFKVRYRMYLQGGGDVWRICGVDESDHFKWLSTPISYDENQNILKTLSGSVYEIMSYEGNKEAFVTQITQDIEKGSYKVH